jgi:zinc transport system substrate-binding protein
LLLTVSCQQHKERKRPLLLASIHPYELLLKQLAGSDFDVQCIIPANASPHTWSPNPSDLKAIMEASFILSNGLGLEAHLENSFATRAFVRVQAAKLIKDAIPHPVDEQHEADGDHQHLGQDPHLWTSPRLMIRLVTAVANELSRRFPNSALVFRQNAETMRRELDEAAELIKTEREAYLEPGLITYHNTFYYFTKEFDIKYLGWVQFSPGKEPRPKDLAGLGETIQAHKVKAVFIEPQMDRKAGEVLAKEFGLKLLLLDSLGSDAKAKTIAELILTNWDSMKEAFTEK